MRYVVPAHERYLKDTISKALTEFEDTHCSENRNVSRNDAKDIAIGVLLQYLGVNQKNINTYTGEKECQFI